MNETDDIEVEYLEPETVEEEIFEHQRKSGVGFIPILGVGVAAAILGAVGGAFGAQYFAPKPDLSAVQTQIERAVADVKDTNAKEVASLKKAVQMLSQQTSETTNQVDLTEKITAINRRLETLENAPESTLSDISPETLSALQAAQADGFVWPDTDELQTELSDVKAELALLKSDISAIQSQPFNIDEVVAEQIVTQGLIVDEVSFPLQDLLNAAKSGVEEKGFLARTLNKHVKVKDANDPIVLIEQVESAIEKGDMETAIAAFDKLPEDIRVIGQGWRNSVQVK